MAGIDFTARSTNTILPPPNQQIRSYRQINNKNSPQIFVSHHGNFVCYVNMTRRSQAQRIAGYMVTLIVMVTLTRVKASICSH